MPAQIEFKYADVNNVRLHYAMAGTGKLIIFMHGFPEFWYLWEKQLEFFGQTHQAVAMDMRGYNLSSKPEGLENYQIPVLVEDVRALAESLGHEKFILVAHDWGGIVAWHFANINPDWLEKLIIINAPHPTVFGRELAKNKEQQDASQYVIFFRSPDAEAVLSANNYQGLLAAISSEDIGITMSDEEKQKYIDAWSQPGALTGGLNYYRAAEFEIAPSDVTPEDNTAGLESVDINVPTLVIWGEKDTALKTGNLIGLDEFIPDLIIKRIPEGTHWVIREKPDLINSYIKDFIS